MLQVALPQAPLPDGINGRTSQCIMMGCAAGPPWIELDRRRVSGEAGAVNGCCPPRGLAFLVGQVGGQG